LRKFAHRYSSWIQQLTKDILTTKITKAPARQSRNQNDRLVSLV
jgi:hypothetical protein